MAQVIDYQKARPFKVRTAAGAKAEFGPELNLYSWSGRFGCLADLRDAANEIARIGPDRVTIHGNPSEISHDGAAAIGLGSRLMGGPGRLALGIGGDGWASDWRYGRATAAQVVAPLVRAVALGYSAGVRFFIPNLEAAWKDDNGGRDLRALDDIEKMADEVAAAMAAAAPDAIFALSSYDLPKYHASMRAVMRPFSRRFPLRTGQTYVAEAGVPRRGLLPGRIDAFEIENRAAAGRGWVTQDVVGVDDVYEDCDCFPTLQGHKTHPIDLAAELIANPVVALWSAPSIVDAGRREDGRLDAQGIDAAAFAMHVRRAGFCGERAIEAFQQSIGATPDGKLGPDTFRRAGFEMPRY